jgi:peptide/nickel transport system permease protein
LAGQILSASGVASAQPKSDYKPTKRGGGGSLKTLFWQGPTLLNPHFAVGDKDQTGSRVFYEPLACWDPADFTAHLEGPSAVHPLGTDDLGQDLLARMLYGGRISLAVGLAAMLVGVVIGTIVGAIAGISRSLVDTGLMWLTNLFLSLPQLPLLLLIIYLFRDSLKKVVGPEAGAFILIVAVVGGFRWMTVARLMRAQFLSLREKEFVEAARALGASKFRQAVHHILPNALGPVIVTGSIDVANAIIAESTLSFLGLGFPSDIPTWGRLLFEGKDYLDSAPHWALFAGTAIFVTVLSINFAGDRIIGEIDHKPKELEEIDAVVERLREFLRLNLHDGSRSGAAARFKRFDGLFLAPRGNLNRRTPERITLFLDSIPIESCSGMAPTGYEYREHENWRGIRVRDDAVC